jgi:NhaC family Na+:H+ antiporter
LAATLGVPTLSFLPYAVFNFASPLLVILFAYAGLRMMRASGTQEQTSTPRKAAGGDSG